MCYCKNVPSLFSVFTCGNPTKLVSTNPIINRVKGFSIYPTPFIVQSISLLVGLPLLPIEIGQPPTFHYIPNSFTLHLNIYIYIYIFIYSDFLIGVITPIKEWWTIYKSPNSLQFHLSRLTGINKNNFFLL